MVSRIVVGEGNVGLERQGGMGEESCWRWWIEAGREGRKASSGPFARNALPRSTVGMNYLCN